ncbi:MAG: phasin family protein [Desulfobulbia bacterium]
MSKMSDFEIPESIREMAEKNVDQAQEAYENFVEATRKAQKFVTQSSEAMSSGTKSVHEQAVSFAQSNMEASFELANKLVKAQDLKEAIELQSEFAREQMEAYLEQSRKLTELVQETTKKAQQKS